MAVQVLYLTEPIDEPTISALTEFEGKQFVDVSREGLDLGEEEEEKKKVRLPFVTSLFVIQSRALSGPACTLNAKTRYFGVNQAR